MSAPLTLDSTDLTSLSRALDGFGEITRKYGVRLDAYGPIAISINGQQLDIRWDSERGHGEYVIDDRIGS